ncbi:MAG: hypothetical protein IRY99_00625 [Isosphaeraceae bacterium]|nr:hypothetical protein [Isosphaeraceae bacterium]
MRPAPRSRRGAAVSWAAIVGLGVLHSVAIAWGMGGIEGIGGRWPLARHDHPLYFHSALVTRHFLRLSGTTAGYDPSFMAGYAKSVVFPASSTLPELVIALFGRERPVLAYKLYVLVSASLLPWVLALTCQTWGLRPSANALAVLLFELYVWTDFPINYAGFGMLPYLLAIPIALLAAAAVGCYLERGGLARWLGAALGASLAFLIHLTTPMVLAPSAGAAYVVAVAMGRQEGRRFPLSRHLGFWLIPALALAVNAFWWWPGLWLASTKGESGFAFAHPEPLGERLLKIVLMEPPIQSLLWAFGLIGAGALIRRDRSTAAALLGFLAAGFGWGYLAGASRQLDFLQPGRHTYALYTGATVAAALGLAELWSRLVVGRGKIATLAAVGLVLIVVRMVGPGLVSSVRFRLFGREPFLASRPTSRLLWIIDRVKAHVRPGERLLYEEGGFNIEGLPDPFDQGRFSGLLPYLTGVEVLGGPYLHVALATNFTQFGEGKLFGAAPWGREHFVRYARLYRPAAILCWTPWARAFCASNRDLIEILADDGTLLFGRVLGFEGETIQGQAEVSAEPGRLHVRAGAAELDGRIILRYHSVPYLRSRPPVPLEAVFLEGDPVPFIGLRPTREPLTLELDLPP